ncbi:monocarboxylate transporter 12-like [Parasteatoda tepidariorum]|uniref:monocarboxylate transporter 12-like n=1 Tax=Parasteatoda tepidariorum TaxID=114398 RepID=UPI0039BCB87C
MLNVEVPDKGFAWIVAVSSFFINFILSGHYRSVGILYVEILNYYNASRQEATIPFAVMNAVRCLSGPFVGIVGQRYGVRSATFWGGLIGTIGVALCFVAPDIIWMAAFWGGLYGLGCSLSNTLFRVSVNEYFVKYRATAAGISISGGCVGSMTLPFLINYLVKHYGLAGTFLILAGITLHVLPLSLMLREPLWIKDPQKYEELIDRMHKAEKHDAAHPLKSAIQLSRLMIIPKIDRSGITGFSNNLIEEMKFMTFRRKCPWKLKKVRSLENLNLSDTDTVISSDEFDGTLSLPNIENLPETPSKIKNFFKSRLFSRPTEEDSESSDTHSDDSAKLNELSFTESLKTLILLYKNPMYIIICISVTSYQIIYVAVLQILIDYSVDKGIPSFHAIYLLNILSIGDLIGK